MTATHYPITPSPASGLLNPVFSGLQLRALRTALGWGTMFFLGLGLITAQLYSMLPPEVVSSLVAVAGVRTGLAILVVWIVGAVVLTTALMLVFIRQHVSGPAAELSRVHEAVARGELTATYRPA